MISEQQIVYRQALEFWLRTVPPASRWWIDEPRYELLAASLTGGPIPPSLHLSVGLGRRVDIYPRSAYPETRTP